MNLKYKYFYNFENFFLILFLIILFFPKLDLIEIPNYWQGIRLEDIALVTYGLIILLNYEEKIINNQQLGIFKPLLIFFIIIFISSFIGKLSSNPIEIVSLIRVLEYTIIIILLSNLNLTRGNFIKFIKIYLCANLIFIILQKFGIVGSFTSIGYLDPSHPQNTRSIGLTGGSWEIGVIFSICYFIIIKYEKPNYKITFLYFFLILLINIISENRMNAIGFVLANVIFLKHNLTQKQYFRSLILLFLFGIISFLFLKDYNISGIDRLLNTNYSDAIILIKNFVFFQELPPLESLDNSVWSLWYRLSLWGKLIIPYTENFYTILFGSGLYTIYFESTVLRIIFTTGIIGLIYTIYKIKEIELYILVYFIIVGLTLDIFNSMKIFSFVMLYYRFFDENYSYRRN